MSGAAPPDVVYVVRRGIDRQDQELRHSLRSLRNVPHGRVWLASPERPRCLSDEVGFIQTRERTNTKWLNLPVALLQACKRDELAERFLYFNDDFFVTAPLDEVPVMHRGPVSETKWFKAPGMPWAWGYRQTDELLRAWGFEENLSYELHVPLPVVKDRMREVLERGLREFKGACLHSRTLYGNRWRIGGAFVEDFKVYSRRRGELREFLSTDEGNFKQCGVPELFPDPCRYEVTR